MAKRFNFPQERPERFFGLEDHIDGLDPEEEERDADRRVAIWDEGYMRLNLLQRAMLALGLPVRTTFEVVTTGPNPGVRDSPTAG